MSPAARRVVTIVITGLGGALIGLLVGLIAIAVAPDNGFGDLAAAAVTTVFLIPMGLVIGALVGWWVTRRRVADSGHTRPAA